MLELERVICVIWRSENHFELEFEDKFDNGVELRLEVQEIWRD